MGKVDYYRDILKGIKDTEIEVFLLEESGLPGARANLELIQAIVEEYSEGNFLKYITYNCEKAPTNSPYEFIAMCGVVGLGKLLVEGKLEYFDTLRMFSSDSRWRIREAVAMALQYLGEREVAILLKEMINWSKGNLLEKRAVIAALCEPKLLKRLEQVRTVLDILDEITESLIAIEDRKNEDFRVLRKSLGYCWSVAVAAMPEEGKRRMEKWVKNNDKDIKWIMKENFKKTRIIKMDSSWVEKWKIELGCK